MLYGSKIDKSCSDSKLVYAIEANKPKVHHQPLCQEYVPEPFPAPCEEQYEETTSIDFSLGLFKVSPSCDYVPVTETTWYKSRRRKPKKGRSL